MCKYTILFLFCFVFSFYSKIAIFSHIHVHSCFSSGKQFCSACFFFCWFALCFLEKQAKNVVRPTCHCHKTCWDINGESEQGDAIAKQNTENISLEALWISGFRPRYEMVNGPQLTMPPFFSFEVIPNFPTGSPCPPQPIFTSSAEQCLGPERHDKRHNSLLLEVPEN